MLEKISGSTGGKVGIGAVVLIVLGIAVYSVFGSVNSMGGGYGKQVSVQDAGAQAQKAIDQLKTNDKIPDSVKKIQIAHLQAEVDAANGHRAAAPQPPTKGG